MNQHQILASLTCLYFASIEIPTKKGRMWHSLGHPVGYHNRKAVMIPYLSKSLVKPTFIHTFTKTILKEKGVYKGKKTNRSSVNGRQAGEMRSERRKPRLGDKANRNARSGAHGQDFFIMQGCVQILTDGVF